MAGSFVMVGSGDHRVIALHGWFGSALGWGHLADYLNTSQFCYVFPDLRGYGSRKDEPGDFTMAEAAADAIALADELGWERFSLIGHSMGGKAIHQVLLQAPDRVRKLVAVNPVPATEVPMDPDSWALFSGAADSAANRAAIIGFTTGNRLTKTFIDQLEQHSLDASTVEAFGAYLQSWAKGDFSGSLKPDRATPVRVIVGETDPALSEEVMRQTWMVFFPDAELEVLTNAGHYPMFETPVALATSIEEFLEQD
jgi:pimeloyl-ACP methyl ester carboxylesterase